MKQLKRKVVAITGAGSGIGRALAMRFAQEGSDLAIADYNNDALERTKKLLEKYEVNVSTHLVDVANRMQMDQYATDVIDHHGRVHMIVNNAGVHLTETVEDMKYEDLEWIFGINFLGVVHGTKAFLPYLKQQDEARIVNISSVNGLIGAPIQSAYCATKFAVKGFTEVLRFEMMGSPVKVSCVHPGGVTTNIIRKSRFYKNFDLVADSPDQDACSDRFDNFFGISTPESAADEIVKGIKKDKYRILIGRDARFIDRVSRLLPVTYPSLVGWYYLHFNRFLAMFNSRPSQKSSPA
jgi:short-subunit dehydrogenase